MIETKKEVKEAKEKKKREEKDMEETDKVADLIESWKEEIEIEEENKKIQEEV